MRDGLHQVSLSKTGRSPYVEGVVSLAGKLCNGQRRGKGQVVVGSGDKVFKRIARIQSGCLGFIVDNNFLLQLLSGRACVGSFIIYLEGEGKAELIETHPDHVGITLFNNIDGHGQGCFHNEDTIVFNRDRL